jgi:cytolysin-activating lysine-acyltransferase
MALWSKKSKVNGDDASSGKPNQTDKQPTPADQPKQVLSAEKLQQMAVAAKQQMACFGQIVSILMRTPQFRGVSLAELETLIVPALITNQFVVAEAQSKDNGFVAPVGAAFWALVSPEVDQRLSTNLDQPIKLAPNEWKSGNIPWLVTVIGDARVLNPMIQRLRDTVLKGLPLKIRAKDKEGREVVGTFSAASS